MSAPAKTAPPPVKMDKQGFVRCRVCGCTDREPCNPSCGWFDANMCTTCGEAAGAIAEWLVAARRANRAALWREAERQAAQAEDT